MTLRGASILWHLGHQQSTQKEYFYTHILIVPKITLDKDHVGSGELTTSKHHYHFPQLI